MRSCALERTPTGLRRVPRVMALLNRNSFILLDGEARILQQLLEAYLQEQAVLGCSGGDRMDVRPDTVTPAEALGTRLAAPEEEKYSMDTLTIQQAFEAMQLFLVSYYERTQSEDVGALLGDLQCM